VKRREAEQVYEQGRDAVIEVLLALSAQNERLAAQVEKLTAKVVAQDERIALLERRLAGRRAARRSRPVKIRRVRRRGVARIRRGARRALSPAMRARAVSCCRSRRSTRSLSIGPARVAVGTSMGAMADVREPGRHA
jgi:hypothetical protein